MKTSIQPRSALGSSRFERMDAEYLRTRYVALEESLRAIGGMTLDSLVDEYDGPVVNKDYLAPDARIGYLDIDGVSRDDGMMLLTEMKYSERPSRATFVMKAGDVLLSNVRPNRGAVAMATERVAGSLATSGFTLLRHADDAVEPPNVLYAFLRTKFARLQLIRRNRGSMYPAVLSRDVMEMLVPTFAPGIRDEISQNVGASLASQDEFFKRHAEQMAHLDSYLAPIGVPPSPLESVRQGEPDITIVSRRQAVREDERLDAEFWREEYRDYHDRLRATVPTFWLGDHYSLAAGRASAGDDIVPTLKQRVLTNVGVNWSAVLMEAGRATKNEVHQGDILLASTAHEIAYVGAKVDLVRDMPPEASACNQAVAELMVIRAKTSKPAHIPNSYVAAFLRHEAGRHQVQRCIRGLRGGHTYPQDIARHVLVPDPGAAWLLEFENFAERAERTRREAKASMAKAVGTAESAISAALTGV